MRICQRIQPALYAALALLVGSAPAAAHLEKINLGLYGGQVADIAAIENASGDTEVLIAVDSSQRGVFKWNEASGLWSSMTFPVTTSTGDIPGAASHVEGNPNSPTDVYTVINSETDKSALYVSDDYGDVSSSSVVSFVEALKGSGDQLDDVTTLVGADSGVYAGTTMGEVWLNTGGASDTFTSVFSQAAGGRVVSLTVTGSSSGYVLMENSGVLSLWHTNWVGGDTDRSATLPTAAPVELRTGACPIDDCSLDVHRVGADPEDPSGETLYIAGSSVNGMAFRSTDGGLTWNNGWDYRCSISGSGCDAYGLSYGYPQVILFQGTAAAGSESRYVYISVVARDNDATTPTWDPIPNLSSTIRPSGPSGPVVIDFTTHANDSALAIDPNDDNTLYVATDLAIGQITHNFSTGLFADPSGEEMGNAKGIEGVVINDIDFYEISSTNKDLWIATKSGVGKGLNFDPTDPTSTEDAEDWVYPIFPKGDGAPPSAVAINTSNNADVLVGNGKVYRNEMADSLPQAAQDWVLTFDPLDFAGPGEPLESDRADRTRTTAIEYEQSGTCTDHVFMTAANEDTGLEGGVFQSDDGGTSWEIDTYDDGSLLKMPVNALWTSECTVWIGVGDKSAVVPRSSDTGVKARKSLCFDFDRFWTPPCSSLPGYTAMQNEIIVAIDGVTVAGDQTVYVAGQESVYKGTHPSAGSLCEFCNFTFTDVTPPGATAHFTSVAVDTADADHVWVSYGNCIQESTDGGANWSDYGDTCEPDHEFVRKLIFDDLLSGTDNGLFAYAAPEPSAAILGLATLGFLAGLARRRKKLD